MSDITKATPNNLHPVFAEILDEFHKPTRTGTKTTPRPWHLDGEHIWHFGEGYESPTDPNRSTGIEITKSLRDSPIAKANAELIVLSVNSYDAMKEALESEICSILCPDTCCGKMRAALALARGEVKP
jgi:hypothetical protein